MGLDITHGAWHGAYSAFMQWREKICEIAGFPPLRLMQGFYQSLDSGHHPTLYAGAIQENSYSLKSIDQMLPIKWDCLKPNPLHELLYHSDCDGEIPWKSCGPIAEELSRLIPSLKGIEDQKGHIGNWVEKTQTFIDGLEKAFAARENLVFH